jgi:uncharacterized tellurite resistance protein B-like protein
MFDLIKSLLNSDQNDDAKSGPDLTDPKLCSAALLVHVLSADGVVRPEEESKLREIVIQKFGLSEAEAQSLYEEARKATNQSSDVYAFTSTLKREMDEPARIALVKHLWEIVFSDGKMHEMEDNVVWRIAELLAVSSRDRMYAKQDALREMN